MMTGAGGILGDRHDDADETPAGTCFTWAISATWACNSAAVGLRINTLVAVGSDTAIGEGLRAAAVPLSSVDVESDNPLGEGLRAVADPLAADAACSKALLMPLIEKALCDVAMPLGLWPPGDEQLRITHFVPGITNCGTVVEPPRADIAPKVQACAEGEEGEGLRDRWGPGLRGTDPALEVAAPPRVCQDVCRTTAPSGKSCLEAACPGLLLGGSTCIGWPSAVDQGWLPGSCTATIAETGLLIIRAGPGRYCCVELTSGPVELLCRMLATPGKPGDIGTLP